jgi:small subunit ribosomal protein S23e
MGSGKPKGTRAGRKLANKRRIQKWNDKEYNKRLLGSRFKNPFKGSCMAVGIVEQKVAIESKQPNSAVRKAVKVRLKKNNKKVTAFVPWDGSINQIT